PVTVAGLASAGADRKRAVALDELIRIARRRPRDSRDRPSPAIPEADLSARELDDRVPALVHERVVTTTKQDEVVELRLPATCPVPDVVRIEEAAALAAGEAAAAVPRLQRPAHRCWNRPRLPPH